MAKNSSPNSNPADKDSAAYCKASSKLTESELSLVNAELGSNLRRAAVFFIAELKDRFDPVKDRLGPKRTKSNRANSRKGDAVSPGANLIATEFADKFVRLGREHSDTRDTDTLLSNSKIRNLFYDPSMFEKGTWRTLSLDERLRIIATGLKVVGPIIVERYRADLVPPVRKARQVETTEAPDASLHEYDVEPARLLSVPSSNAAPAALAETTSATNEAGPVEELPKQTQQPAVNPIRRRHVTSTTRPPTFELSILKTKLDLVPWEDQKLDGAIRNKTQLKTFLDLLNLSHNEFRGAIRTLGCSLDGFKDALKAVRDEKNMSHGRALALLFSPLDNAEGGIGLSPNSVVKLNELQVYPFKWQGNDLVVDDKKGPVPIDNGWRLLRHYEHTRYSILTQDELTVVRDLFRAAGFYSPKNS